MSKHVSAQDPSRFGLASFSDLLSRRTPILGEDPGSFAEFHVGMVSSLAAATPYECVIAENLIAIEWELLQHRRMRDASLRQIIRTLIQKASVAKQEQDHQLILDKSIDDHVLAGGSEDDWVPEEFDMEAAEGAGGDLARRAISKDKALQRAAEDELVALGMDPLEIMGAAYRTFEASVVRHDDKLLQLEHRRRDVKRDFDGLQKARPVEAEVIDG